MTARDAAVKAAAEAIHARDCGCSDFAGFGSDEPDDVYYVRLAEAAVAAVAPILLADERARIAAAIRRLGETPQVDGALVLPLHPLVLDYIEAAASIAETAPETTTTTED